MVGTTTLGSTGITVSRLALGTMMLGPIGNPDPDECDAIVRTALDAGITLIDTADMYSAGESERHVGRAIRGRRDEVVLATKGYFPLEDGLSQGGSSRRHLVQAVEGSLRRLDTDRIDLYQLHRPDWDTDLEETLDALGDLVRAGKIRAVGCSGFPAHAIVDAHRLAAARGTVRLRTEQPPYNLLARGIERDVLPVAQRWGMGVLTWSPLAFGFLTGRHRMQEPTPAGGRAALRPAWFDPQDPTVQRKLGAVERLVELADELGCTLPGLAIAFTQSHRAVTSTIIGPRTVDQLRRTLAETDLELDDDVLDRIDAIVPPGHDVYDPIPPADLPWIGEPASMRRPAGARSPHRAAPRAAGYAHVA